MAAASTLGFYKPDRPAAAATTTEVPAVLGLGRVGVESLLRNADLVPRFRFVRGAAGASVDTAIRQSPVGGDLASVESSVTVVINIGPADDTAQPNLVARDDFRPRIGQSSVTAERQSSLTVGSGSASRRQARESDSGDANDGSDKAETDKAKGLDEVEETDKIKGRSGEAGKGKSS